MKHNRIDINRQHGFTLLEIITSVTIFSVLILAISMLLQNAMRMRSQAQAMADERIVRVQAKSVLEQDLVNMIPANSDGTIWLISQYEVTGGARRDQLEFFSSTGFLSPGAHLGDVQKIVYALVPNENGLQNDSFSLMRHIYRNIYAEYEDDPLQNRIMDSAASLAFQFYDGETWQNKWDSTEQEPPMPEAIKVQMTYKENPQEENVESIEFIVPIHSERFEEETESGSSSEDEDESTASQSSTGGGNFTGGGNQGGQGGRGGGNQGGQGGGNRGGER